MRLDQYLYSHELAKSRTHALHLIEDGIKYKDKIITKPSFQIDENEDKENVIILNPSKYVSRGGLKLEKALDCFSIDVNDKIILDLGSSTGGFADCLIQRNCKKVYCIDVGTSQLDPSLASNERIVSMENTNAKSLTFDDFGFYFDLITCDLSFISQSKIYTNVIELLKDDGYFISLIKPQFELDQKAISKKGIVIDKNNHKKAILNLFSIANSLSIYPIGLCNSPILGGSGNREYLALFSKTNKNIISNDEIIKIINS